MDFNSFLLPLNIPNEQKIFFIFVVPLTFIVAGIRIWLRIDLSILSSQVNDLIESKKNHSEALSSKVHPVIKKTIKRCENYKNRGNSDNAVIIDQVYSQNKLWILFLAARRDSWDFVCRSFPNILISLGLLCTLIGITYSLTSIQKISQVSQINEVIIAKSVQELLSGVASAFISSLIALACGIFLTFINLIFNTTVAKYRFLSLLEDYLNNSIAFSNTTTDNLLTSIKGDLTSFRSEIVEAFKTTISEAIGQSFANQVALIITENQRATQNLSESANRFMESSGTISNSAESFKYTAEFLSQSNLPNSINNFSVTIDKATSIFEQTSTSISESSSQFHEAVQKLDIYTQDFGELHKALSQLMQITQSNQENLLEAMPIIQNDRQVLIDTVELIRELQSSIKISAKSLDIKAQESILVQEEIIKLTKSINSVTKKITDKLYQGLDFDSLHNDNQIIIELLEKLASNLEIDETKQLERQSYSPQMSHQIDELISIVNVISSHIANDTTTLNMNNYQSADNLNDITNDLQQIISLLSANASVNNESDSQNNSNILQVEGVGRIVFQISNMQKLIGNINEQIIVISNNSKQNDQTALFPTVKKIMSKRIIGN